MIFQYSSFLLIGLVLLYFGGEILVSGITRTAKSMNIGAFVLGATVVAFGTSAPEMVVSITASIQNSPDIAISNIVGSNIANIGLILGITPLFGLMAISPIRFKREMPVLFTATLLTLCVLWDGMISRGDGLLLLVGFVLYLYYSIKGRKISDADLEKSDDKKTKSADNQSLLKNWGMIIIGLGVLIFGGHIMVQGGIGLATIFGISQWVIGATIVAFGTSAPEIAASAVAVCRGKPEIAYANVLGSLIFNMLLVLGVASMIMPLSAQAKITLDLYGLMALTVLFIIFAWTGYKVTKIEGGILMALYVLYICHSYGIF